MASNGTQHWYTVAFKRGFPVHSVAWKVTARNKREAEENARAELVKWATSEPRAYVWRDR